MTFDSELDNHISEVENKLSMLRMSRDKQDAYWELRQSIESLQEFAESELKLWA